MQVGTGKSVLNGIAIGKLKIYKKKDTAISTAPVADTAAELERFEAARQKAIEQQTELDYLIYNDPLGYADLILNGAPEEYLKNVAGSHGLED